MQNSVGLLKVVIQAGHPIGSHVASRRTISNITVAIGSVITLDVIALGVQFVVGRQAVELVREIRPYSGSGFDLRNNYVE